MSTIEILKRCEIFIGLDSRDLQKIADLPSCQEKTYKAQEIIFKTGEGAKHLYVLQEGRVNLAVDMPSSPPHPPNQTVVRAITKGGIFGWSALVPPHVRIMSAFAKETSKLLVLSGNELRTLFDSEPRLGYEVSTSLVKVIASRVWNLEQLLITGKGSPFVGRSKTS